MSKPDGTQLETPYLLGRAWVEVWHIKGRSQNLYINRANKAYQQAHDNFHRCDTLWMSVGLLFYFVGQFGDCFDSFVSSIRLNPKIPLVWRNLGILVSRTVDPGNDVVKLKVVLSMINAVNIQMPLTVTRKRFNWASVTHNAGKESLRYTNIGHREVRFLP